MSKKLYVTEADLVEMGILSCRRTAGRAVKRGDLPAGTKVGHRIVWKLSEVEAHLAARKVIKRGAR